MTTTDQGDERRAIIRAAVAAMPSTNPLVADDLIEGHTMHTEADDIVAIWKAAQRAAAQPVAQEAITWSPAGYNKELAVDATGKVRGEVCEHSIDPRWDARTNDARLGEYLNRDQAKAAVLAALAAPQPSQRAPIDMMLHCPACGKQHIDAQEITDVTALMSEVTWANPPHRSHLCHGCGHIWRPADVPTNGVAAVKTKGKADSPIATPSALPAQAVGEKVHPGRTPPDYKILNEVAAQALAMRVERLAAPMPQPEPTSKGDMIEVVKEDANNYCRILRLLGMEEEGDPVAEVQRLVDASQQREPQEAAERPANFTELWELYSRVGDAHENHGRNHEKTMEARATFHAALMRALSAPQEASKVEAVAVADEGEVSDVAIDSAISTVWEDWEDDIDRRRELARAVLAFAGKAKKVRNG